MCVGTDIIEQKGCMSFNVRLAKGLKGRMRKGVLQEMSEFSVPEFLKILISLS